MLAKNVQDFGLGKGYFRRYDTLLQACSSPTSRLKYPFPRPRCPVHAFASRPQNRRDMPQCSSRKTRSRPYKYSSFYPELIIRQMINSNSKKCLWANARASTSWTVRPLISANCTERFLSAKKDDTLSGSKIIILSQNFTCTRPN